MSLAVFAALAVLVGLGVYLWCRLLAWLDRKTG